MEHKPDFDMANPGQIAKVLGLRLSEIRLSKNQTQEHIAHEAGISRGTLVRLEQGRGASLDSFIRVIMALNLQEHLAQMLPDPSIRPLDRVRLSGRERQRARPTKPEPADEQWTWGADE